MHYLLDTSVLSGLVNPKSQHYTKTSGFRDGMSSTDRQWLCTVSVGEMVYGRELLALKVPPVAAAQLASVDAQLKAVQQIAEILPITHHVARKYGALRAHFARGVAPNAIGGWCKGKPPEIWYQQTSAARLKITENDLWIAAAALAYDLMLVTCDKDFDLIALHVKNLRVVSL